MHKLKLAGIFFICLSMLGLTTVAKASDTITPAVETVCDGLEGDMFGICNAYCEAMDCDNPDHKASDKACYKKAQRWAAIAEGKVIPCNEAPKVSLSKEVNAEGPLFEILVGEPVVYTFKILNEGNVALYHLELSDDELVAAQLEDCAASFIGVVLETGEEHICVSDEGEIPAENKTVVNLAKITALSLSGSQVSATDTAQYTGVINNPPLAITVNNLNDSGAGSLREALALIGDGGTISFDPSLAGQVIALTSGQLVASVDVTVDASAAPGLVVSGSGISRVVEVIPGAEVSMNDLEVADGVGAPQGGGILNNGTLNLDRVVVRDNTETSAGPASFNFGGGGIYNGDGATLNLTDSTVADNGSINQPGGGVYGFFNSTVNITRSTISGNFGGDVAGGLRTLGNLTVVNSTISGNVSANWHGGAAFITDGVATIVNSTITGNAAPAGTAGGLMVATFGAPVSVTVTNSIVANNGSYDCQVEGGGAASLESGGNNVFADASCNPVGSDLLGADPLLGPLADNGGPTLTQALLTGSPAIDTANNADCPVSDQRGLARPQGAGCDAGAFEAEP
jgi:hypothetical protein